MDVQVYDAKVKFDQARQKWKQTHWTSSWKQQKRKVWKKLEWDTPYLYSTLRKGSSPKENPELRTSQRQNNKMNCFEDTIYEQTKDWMQDQELKYIIKPEIMS